MLSNRLYYQFKPYLPWRLRMAVRRVLARLQRYQAADTWPINESAGRTPEGWPGWPEGKKFALVLTHDVEGMEGLNKCRQLMQLEQSLGFRSSFNFIPEGEYRVSADQRQELLENGFEVGVHDLRHDGKLYSQLNLFPDHARSINKYLKDWGASGFRSGFMLHNRECLHELDLLYDASTFDTDPFEPQPEGVGTIFPFWVPPLAKPNASNLARQGYVELPYTLVQDSTLFLVLRERSPNIWFQKLDWIVRHGGMALVNVHPDYLRFPGEPPSARTYPIEFYIELLNYIRRQYAGLYWQPLPKAVAYFVTTACCGQDGTSRTKLGADGATLVVPQVIPSGRIESGEPKNVTKTVVPKSLTGQRIASVVFSYYPSDPRPRRAATALAQEGAEVDFLCLRRDPSEPRQQVVDGLNVFRIPLRRRRGSKVAYLLQYAIFISAAFFFLWRRSWRKRYDLVHVHNMPDILVFSALIPKLFGAKIILDLHDPMPELMETIFKFSPQSFAVRFLKLCEKWSIGFSDLVLTPNLAFRDLFTSRSCSVEKLQIVMNAPSEETFPFRPLDPEAMSCESGRSQSYTILYHGSLVARHGLDLAIDALEIARRSIPNATIAICGESTAYFEEVLEDARRRGLQDAIRYLGMKSQREIADVIAQCDLGVIPNRRNVFTEINMPTRIFEYLALGKPVIAPGTRGIRDYFTNEDILFFQPDNTVDLADRIAWAHRHPRELATIVRRGQIIYQKHRWSGQRERFVFLVASLLGKQCTPQCSATSNVEDPCRLPKLTAEVGAVNSKLNGR